MSVHDFYTLLPEHNIDTLEEYRIMCAEVIAKALCPVPRGVVEKRPSSGFTLAQLLAAAAHALQTN